MPSNALVVGALSGALTVALGAFGAHALADRLDERELELWRTAVLYQGLHAPALGLAGLLEAHGARARIAGFAFSAGTLLFSGSLYALALGAPRFLGAITPFGGAALMAGWIALAVAGRRISCATSVPAGESDVARCRSGRSEAG